MNIVQSYKTRSRIYRLDEDGCVVPGSGAEGTGVGTDTPVGFGDVVNSFSQKQIGVAIYSSGQELRVVIGRKKIDLLRPEIRAERSTVFPFVKKFTVWRDAACLISFKYLWTDAFDDPHAGTTDVLRFISEVSESRERRLRFYLVWQAVQLGQDVTSDEVRAQIEESVKRTCL